MCLGVQIGDKQYKTKKEALVAVRAYWDHCPVNYRIHPTDHEFSFFHALVLRHPNAAEKFPEPIIQIAKLPNAFGQPEMQVKLASGRWVSLAWRRCITGYVDDERTLLFKALRNSIMDSIHEFKLHAPKFCEQCGEPGSDFDADHQSPSFSSIVADFLEEYGTKGASFKKDRTNLVVFASEEYRAIWLAFHADRAVLQLLCKPCHKVKTYAKQFVEAKGCQESDFST